MTYRVGRPEDWPDITELLGLTGVYGPIDASVMADGGHWIVATDDSGLVGCAWVLASGKHAYVDCVAIRPDRQNSGAGPRLCVRVVQFMKAIGVEHMRSLTVNPLMERIVQSLGGFSHDDGYVMLYLNTGD